MADLKIRVSSARLIYNKKHLRQTMRTAGAEVAATARALIRNSSGGGKTYRGAGGSAAAFRGGYRKGLYQASAPGSAPSSITGTLAKSIRVRPFKSGDGVSIKDAAFYALFLEAGAQGGGGRKGARNVYKQHGGKKIRVAINGIRVLQARPFLSAALDARKGSLGPRIQASLQQDIKLVKMRP